MCGFLDVLGLRAQGSLGFIQYLGSRYMLYCVALRLCGFAASRLAMCLAPLLHRCGGLGRRGGWVVVDLDLLRWGCLCRMLLRGGSERSGCLDFRVACFRLALTDLGVGKMAVT